jgi:hypothetical protein
MASPTEKMRFFKHIVSSIRLVLLQVQSISSNSILIVKQLFIENHDLQVRVRWGRDDVAIWDEYITPDFNFSHLTDNI